MHYIPVWLIKHVQILITVRWSKNLAEILYLGTGSFAFIAAYVLFIDDTNQEESLASHSCGLWLALSSAHSVLFFSAVFWQQNTRLTCGLCIHLSTFSLMVVTYAFLLTKEKDNVLSWFWQVTIFWQFLIWFVFGFNFPDFFWENRFWLSLSERIWQIFVFLQKQSNSEYYETATILTDQEPWKLSLRKGCSNTVKTLLIWLIRFYNGLTFHRVILNFVIQGGCPNGIWKRWSGIQNQMNWMVVTNTMIVGVLSMAHAGRDTGGSQFYLPYRANTAHLDRNHTCFGKVVEGLK